jgi:hypothetical protein
MRQKEKKKKRKKSKEIKFFFAEVVFFSFRKSQNRTGKSQQREH